MKSFLKNSGFVFATLLLLSGCNNEDEDPIIENEEELITTVVLTFSNDDGVFTAEWKDEDGDGAMGPVVDDITLEAGKSYNVAVELLNESIAPAESITEEVEEEADEHQFFFVVSNGLDLAVAYDDEDADGNPVGLTNTFTAGETGVGTLTVILRHEADKTASGVSDGDPANAGGETDIETTPPFNVAIQ